MPELKPGDMVVFTRNISGEELGYPDFDTLIWKGDLGVYEGFSETFASYDITLLDRIAAMTRQGWWVAPKDVKRLPNYAQPWRPGMKVTVKKDIEAWYSNYGGRPEQWFRSGMVGEIGAVMVPFVTEGYRRHTKHPYFVCVDFLGDDGTSWRVGVDYENLRRVE